MMEEKLENTRLRTFLCHLEIGPMNRPDQFTMKLIKQILSDITSKEVTTNWWSEFSTWEDFWGIIRSGTNLSIHKVVSRINESLESLPNSSAYIEWIDENGNIQINLEENLPSLLQEFTIIARRRKLKRLKDIAAYNVARLISDKSDIQELNLPISLNQLVEMFLDEYLRDLWYLVY